MFTVILVTEELTNQYYGLLMLASSTLLLLFLLSRKLSEEHHQLSKSKLIVTYSSPSDPINRTTESLESPYIPVIDNYRHHESSNKYHPSIHFQPTESRMIDENDESEYHEQPRRGQGQREENKIVDEESHLEEEYKRIMKYKQEVIQRRIFCDKFFEDMLMKNRVKVNKKDEEIVSPVFRVQVTAPKPQKVSLGKDMTDQTLTDSEELFSQRSNKKRTTLEIKVSNIEQESVREHEKRTGEEADEGSSKSMANNNIPSFWSTAIASQQSEQISDKELNQSSKGSINVRETQRIVSIDQQKQTGLDTIVENENDMGGSSKPLTIDRRRLDEFGSEMSSNNGAYDVRQGEIGNSQNMKLSDIFRPNRENSSNAVSNVVPQVQSSSTVVNTGLQYLEQIMVFAENQRATVEIPTKMNNLGGSRSSFCNLYQFTKSFIGSIDKTNDSQLTAFALKIYESIVFTLIRGTNLKDGIERMPPKERTKQVEKNSINCYILTVNIYRLMGFEKLWLIVFGKTLKLLEFIIKRKEDIRNHKELELVKNGYIELRGDITSKYLSRVDYLSYFLFGLTTFDPIEIFTQNMHREEGMTTVLKELSEYGKEWSYNEFWILFDNVCQNNHQSYYQPILYLNTMAIIYPQLYNNKVNKSMNEFVHIYKYLLKEGREYFERMDRCEELRKLTEDNWEEGYEFDGEDFLGVIKVLKYRISEKEGELKVGNAREFEEKASVFYYFWKGK